MKITKINMNRNVSQKMRIYHRYLGFFLTGVMAVYATSGIVMIFRNTDAFKVSQQIETTVDKNLDAEQLGRALRIRRLAFERSEGTVQYFKEGTYDAATGAVDYTKKELPYLLDKMEHMHKATTDSPLFYLNIFFGLSLFFFVLSSFWMFMPGSTPFKKGLYFVLAGIVLTLLMIFL
ncbi:MAG: hypothetical protein KDC44_21590 [Phaeodactylibacter sp.]|nr:hypothetical protein [Phaeodactylibacter sp.]